MKYYQHQAVGEKNLYKDFYIFLGNIFALKSNADYLHGYEEQIEEYAKADIG